VFGAKGLAEVAVFFHGQATRFIGLWLRQRLSGDALRTSLNPTGL